MKKIIKKLPLLLLILFVAIQFVPTEKENPKTDVEIEMFFLEDTKDTTKKLIVSACYDCHSNEVIYPWYSNIAPVSWWIVDHVEHARHHLNFSEWGNYSNEDKAEITEEAAEEVEEGEMPLKPYVLMHSNAKLSEEEVHELEEYFNSLHEIYK